MIGRLREFINKSPWLGWVLFVLVLGVAVFIYFNRTGGTDPYNPDRMVEEITVRFTDTNDEIKMTRGQLDKELRRRGDTVDPSQGIINPKTGQPTGFLFDKDEWDEMIARINQEKAAIRAESGGKSIPAAPRSDVPAPTPAESAPEKK